MAKQTTVGTATPDTVDELRTAQEQAQAAMDAAQDELDELIAEQAALPARKEAAIASGDSAAFLMAQGRAGQLGSAIYFARTALRRAQLAALQAEQARLGSEIPGLKQEFDAAMLRLRQEQGEVNRIGAEIEKRQRRVRSLLDMARRLEEQQFTAQGDFERSTMIDDAPVVRSLPHMAH